MFPCSVNFKFYHNAILKTTLWTTIRCLRSLPRYDTIRYDTIRYDTIQRLVINMRWHHMPITFISTHKKPLIYDLTVLPLNSSVEIGSGAIGIFKIKAYLNESMFFTLHQCYWIVDLIDVSLWIWMCHYIRDVSLHRQFIFQKKQISKLAHRQAEVWKVTKKISNDFGKRNDNLV